VASTDIHTTHPDGPAMSVSPAKMLLAWCFELVARAIRQSLPKLAGAVESLLKLETTEAGGTALVFRQESGVKGHVFAQLEAVQPNQGQQIRARCRRVPAVAANGLLWGPALSNPSRQRGSNVDQQNGFAWSLRLVCLSHSMTSLSRGSRNQGRTLKPQRPCSPFPFSPAMGPGAPRLIQSPGHQPSPASSH
jgi:hypothetical protein